MAPAVATVLVLCAPVQTGDVTASGNVTLADAASLVLVVCLPGEAAARTRRAADAAGGGGAGAQPWPSRWPPPRPPIRPRACPASSATCRSSCWSRPPSCCCSATEGLPAAGGAFVVLAPGAGRGRGGPVRHRHRRLVHGREHPRRRHLRARSTSWAWRRWSSYGLVAALALVPGRARAAAAALCDRSRCAVRPALVRAAGAVLQPGRVDRHGAWPCAVDAAAGRAAQGPGGVRRAGRRRGGAGRRPRASARRCSRSG